MTKRLLLGLILSSGAAVAACDGWSMVLEDTSSSSSSSSGASSGSSSGTTSSSSSGRPFGSGGGSASSGGSGGGSASSGGSGGGSASSGGSGGGSASNGGSGGGSASSSGSGGGGFGGGASGAGGAASALYSTDFEGPCPNGWTLSGDWQCGAPSVVGPPTAFSGTQCIATQIAANYHDNDAWTTTTATSPAIDLTMAPAPKLTFRMWMDSEGSSYDGANLKVSTDNGVSYSILTTVTPTYPAVVAGQPAWGGHQAALGWQLVQADLSAYAGQIILLRFAFRSDSSSVFPGVYIDDVLVTPN